MKLNEFLLAEVEREVARSRRAMRRVGLPASGVPVAHLCDDCVVRLALPFERQSDNALDTALDGVRDRFGSAAVTRAVLLGRRVSESVPMLPD